MFGIRRKKRERNHDAEREHDAQMEKAEADLRDLTARGERAVSVLLARNGRNHWRESIERTIRGAH